MIGPTTMMIAMTTPPITRPAKSPGERESTIPRIANIRMNVPMPSAKIADAQVVVSSLNDVWPIPRSIAGLGEHGPDPERAEHGADDLRGPVGGHLAPREALGGRERERDRGVDVAARDLAERVDERGDDEAEGERDAEQVGARDRGRRVAREHERRDDRAGADQDEQRGAERLGERALAEGVLSTLPPP